MNGGTRHVAFDLLGLAALLGLAGNLLLRAEPWGVNAPLAALALAAGFGLLVRRRGLPLRRAAAWLAVVPLLAAVLAWRSAGPLLALTVGGVLLALVGAALAAHGRTLADARIWDVAMETAATWLHTALGALLLLRDAHSAGIRWRPWHSGIGAVVRGAVLAIPPLVVFGALLMSADAAFAELVGRLLRIDAELVASHVFLTGFFAWIAAGYLHWIVLDDGARVPRGDDLDVRLGMVEVGVVLGAVTLLFVAFIAVQSAYLFGGEERVLATTGLTYAEYARRGFFELVSVAFLLLPLLLLALWLVRGEDPGRRRVIRGLAAALQLLAFLLMGSALFRMRLYQEAYGLTQLRFYTTALMAWLALLFVLFATTVLRERPRRFVTGIAVSVLAGVIVVAAVNPDARIVATNVTRAEAGAAFDAAYLKADIGADGVPALVAGLRRIPPADRCELADWLLAEWGGQGTGAGDWRTWNLARARARSAVLENEATLRGMACTADAG